MSAARRAGTKVSPLVSAHPWLHGVVSEKTRAVLLRAGVERRYATDEVIYLASTPATSLQLVLEGRVRLMRGSRDAVLVAVRDYPDLALALLARLPGRVRLLVERLDQQSGQSTLGRLAQHVLVRATTSRGATFTLGGTQQQIAEEIGTVRELVVRGLRTLRDRNAIESRGGGRYAIVDASLLRAIAATGA
jgi:CRP-like cAMP-binding protein